MAVTEQLILDLSRAQAQIRDLDRELDSLLQPVTVPVELDASDDITRLRRDLANVDANVDIDVSGLQAVDEAADDADRLEREFAQARAEADKVADQAERVKRELREADRASSGFATGIRSAAVALGGFAALRGAFNFVAQGIQDFAGTGEAINRINVLFGELADSAIRFSENSTAALVLTQREALNAVGRFGGLANTVGLAQEASLEFGTTLTSLAVDLASFGDTSVDDAIEALGSALIGESEPLRRYNVLLNEAAVSAKALELGLGGTTGELDEAAKVQARYALILEQTAVAQGDFGRTIDSLSNQLKTTRQDFLAFREDIGRAAAPALEAFLAAAPDLFGGFAESIVNVTDILSTIVSELLLVEGAFEDAEEGAEPFFSALQDGFQLGDLNPFPDIRRSLGTLGDDFSFASEAIEEYTRNFFNVQELGNPLDLVAESTIAASIAAQSEQYRQQTRDIRLRNQALAEASLDLTAETLIAQAIEDAAAAAGRGAAAAQAFSQSIQNLQTAQNVFAPLQSELDAIGQAFEDTFDPDKNGDVFANIDELVADINKQFADAAEFESGLAELARRGFDDAAAVFRERGPETIGLLREALADPAAATELESVLDAVGTSAGEGYADGFVIGFNAASPEIALEIAAAVNNASVQQGIIAGAKEQALIFAANFNPTLLLDDFQISLPASVIQANVGPGADLIGGSSSTDFGAQGSARGGVSVTINNPTVTDLDTSVGQATSTIGAISGLVS